MGMMETEGKKKGKSVGRREEEGFQLWLERGKWGGMPDRERKRVPEMKGPIYWNIYIPKSPPAHPWDTEEKEVENTDEATQRRMEELYQR